MGGSTFRPGSLERHWRAAESLLRPLPAQRRLCSSRYMMQGPQHQSKLLVMSGSAPAPDRAEDAPKGPGGTLLPPGWQPAPRLRKRAGEGAVQPLGSGWTRLWCQWLSREPSGAPPWRAKFSCDPPPHQHQDAEQGPAVSPRAGLGSIHGSPCRGAGLPLPRSLRCRWLWGGSLAGESALGRGCQSPASPFGPAPARTLTLPTGDLVQTRVSSSHRPGPRCPPSHQRLAAG